MSREIKESSRTEKSIRNLIFGVLLQLITIISGFVIRQVTIKHLGLEILSINSLFSEIVTFLSVSELGIGYAITINLFQPLANNDEKLISQIMGGFRKAYQAVAVIVATLGLIILPFIPRLTNDIELSPSYLRIVYLFFLTNTVISYFSSYKITLLNAAQRGYIVSLVSSIVKFVTICIQVAVLITTQNYLLYLFVIICSTILNNIIISEFATRKYPYLNKKDLPDKALVRKLTSNIKDTFVASLSSAITGATDNTLISILTNTLNVGLYSNYNLLINIIKNTVNQIGSAVYASLGELQVSENIQKCEEVQFKLTYIYYIIGSFCSMGAYCISSNVIRLWLGEDYLISDSLIFVCALNLYISLLGEPIWKNLSVSGLFRENSKTGIYGCVINLILSILLGMKYGMIGIFIGTFSTYIVQWITKTYYLYKYKFKISCKRYSIFSTVLFIFGIMELLLAKYLCDLFITKSVILNVFLELIVVIIVFMLFCMLFFIRTNYFRFCFIDLPRKVLLRRKRID